MHSYRNLRHAYLISCNINGERNSCRERLFQSGQRSDLWDRNSDSYSYGRIFLQLESGRNNFSIHQCFSAGYNRLYSYRNNKRMLGPGHKDSNCQSRSNCKSIGITFFNMPGKQH